MATQDSITRIKNFIKEHTGIILFLLVYWAALLYLVAQAFVFKYKTVLEANDLLVLVLVFLAPVILWELRKLLPNIGEFSVGQISVRFRELEEELKEERKRIDQITTSQRSTLHSLAGLVITDPWKIDEYQLNITKREQSKIIIGCQEYTEQLLLCAIIKKLIEQNLGNRVKVITKYDFGGANLNFIALTRGDIDIYPAYTWQGFEMLYATSLFQTAYDSMIAMSPLKAIQELQKIFGKLPLALKWVCYLGYFNNWVLVMLEETAEKYDLRSITDLESENRNLILGCEPDFYARPNGYKLLKSEFDISFKDVYYYDHEDIFENLDNGSVDVIDAFTTDPQLKNSKKYRVLDCTWGNGNGNGGSAFGGNADDKNVFGMFYASILVRQHLLDTHEGLESVLLKLKDKIKRDDISNLIKKSDQVREGQYLQIERYAKDFLEKKELI